MITPPRRAVTRFFIPLIDVLILLFCIFLLMPFVEKEAGSGKLTPGEAATIRRKLDELTRRVHEQGKESLEEIKARLEQAEEELSRNKADKVVVKTFQIDARDGTLTFPEVPPGGAFQFTPILSSEKADDLINKHLSELGAGQELLYIILY